MVNPLRSRKVKRLANHWVTLSSRLPFSLFRKSTVFQGFWHGPELGPLRYSCLKSFVDLGHRFELYAYRSVDVPRGVDLMDAEEVMPRSEIFYYRDAQIKHQDQAEQDLGPFSDLFRFKLLAERGGWWCDVDVICLSSSIPPVRRAWACEDPQPDRFGPGLYGIGTSQLAFGKGDPVVVELYQRCLKMSRTNFEPRAALGPQLISQTMSELGLPENEFGSRDSFYPIHWMEMFKLWLPRYREEVQERCRTAMFLPIYQSFPKYIGLQMANLPPPGSYLGEFCAGHRPNISGELTHRAEEIYNATRAFFIKNREWAFIRLAEVCGESILCDFDLPSE